MTMKWTPDAETAEKFATYRQAIETERELKPDVRERAEAALKAGATGTQLARLTGMTPEVFRRMARDLALPVDPRYRERAEASRKRPAAEQAAPGPAEQPTPPAELGVLQQAIDLSQFRRAQLADWLSEKKSDWYAAAVDGIDAEWVQHVAITKAVAAGHIREIDVVG